MAPPDVAAVRAAPRVADALAAAAAAAESDNAASWGFLAALRPAGGGPLAVLAALRAPAGLPCNATSATAFLGDSQTLLPGGVEVRGLFLAGGSGQEVPELAAWSSAKSGSGSFVVARAGGGADTSYTYSLWQRGVGQVAAGLRLEIDPALDAALTEQHVQLRCRLTLQFPVVQPPGYIWVEHVNSYVTKLREGLREAPVAFVVARPGSGGDGGGGGDGSSKGGGKKGTKADAGEASPQRCVLRKGAASMPGTFADLCRHAAPGAVLTASMLASASGPGGDASAPVVEYSPAPKGSPVAVDPVSLALDVVAYIALDVPLAHAVEDYLLPSVLRQLNGCARLLMQQSYIHQLKVYQFKLATLPFHLASAYSVPKGGDATPGGVERVDADNVAKRRLLHEILGLPADRPLLRVANAWQPGASTADTGSARLANVHVGLPSSGVGGTVSLLSGDYDYYHYMQDRFDDAGWGCAYRSLQTIMSWFRRQHYTGKPVLSHREIQQMLVDMGDKPAKFVGSREWIGAIELSYILDTHMGVTSKLITVSAGADMPSKAREIARHFETQGTPIMIGGGVLAYTLLGIDYNEETGDCAFLILDPHYTGGEDLRLIHGGTWVWWKKIGDKAAAGGELFVRDAFYNLLCPQRPNAI